MSKDKKCCSTCEMCMSSDNGFVCACGSAKYKYGELISDYDLENYFCNDWEFSFSAFQDLFELEQEQNNKYSCIDIQDSIDYIEYLMLCRERHAQYRLLEIAVLVLKEKLEALTNMEKCCKINTSNCTK